MQNKWKENQTVFFKYTSSMRIAGQLSPVVQKCCRLSQRRLARIFYWRLNFERLKWTMFNWIHSWPRYPVESNRKLFSIKADERWNSQSRLARDKYALSATLVDCRILSSKFNLLQFSKAVVRSFLSFSPSSHSRLSTLVRAENVFQPTLITLIIMDLCFSLALAQVTTRT